MQATFAFNRIESALTLIVSKLKDFSSLAAQTERLHDLLRALDTAGLDDAPLSSGRELQPLLSAKARPELTSQDGMDASKSAPTILRTVSPDPGYALWLENLTAAAPSDGRGAGCVIARALDLQLAVGQSILVMGPSGAPLVTGMLERPSSSYACEDCACNRAPAAAAQSNPTECICDPPLCTSCSPTLRHSSPQQDVALQYGAAKVPRRKPLWISMCWLTAPWAARCAGCGKSSLLRVIAGLWTEGSGTIHCLPRAARFHAQRHCVLLLPLIALASCRERLWLRHWHVRVRACCVSFVPTSSWAQWPCKDAERHSSAVELPCGALSCLARHYGVTLEHTAFESISSRVQDCFFLPQKPYMPLGTLRQQLVFPDVDLGASSTQDAQLRELADTVRLPRARPSTSSPSLCIARC